MQPTLERLESREVPAAFGAVDEHYLRLKLGTSYVWSEPELRDEVQAAIDIWTPYTFRSAQERQPRRGMRFVQEYTPAPVRATVIVTETDALDPLTLGRVYPYSSVDGLRLSGALVQISTEQDSPLSVTEVVTHELGHVLGQLHPKYVTPQNAGSIMHSLYAVDCGRELQQGPGGTVSQEEAADLYFRYLQPNRQFEWRPDEFGRPRKAPVRW